MTRTVLLLATLGVAALTLACSGNEGSETATPDAGTVTTAATPSAATPAPATAAASPTIAPASPALPTDTPAAASTQPPAPKPTAPPAPSGPVTIAVSALNLAFDRTSISVPRNSNVTVNFTNNDILVTHDFGVSIPFVPHTETCAGPCQASISFNSGPPGSYTFQCSVHADMVGAFNVN